MKKKQYVEPSVEMLPFIVQNTMKTGSDLPNDPGGSTPAPRRRADMF